ncbi:MAG: dTMP kinase [Bdellovibrionales bacterium]|nr:dTMP kinase [Bdellovibrionales bacterium]
MPGFITIEGVEGSGKSTLRSKLAEFFRDNDKEVIITREPGATILGRSLRNILLSPDTKNLTSTAELMLFCADRAQHVEEVIRPALARGAVVICDRYVHSTLAYQGYGRGLDMEVLRSISSFITKDLMPDMVLLLDLEPETALARVQSRVEKSTLSFNVSSLENQGQIDRFEQQSLEFHTRIRSGFLELAANDPNRFTIINAAAEPEEVARQAIAAIQAVSN